MRVHNIRHGFATNSSSSHSIPILPRNTPLPPNSSDRGDYGWDDFVLANLESKQAYFGTQLGYLTGNRKDDDSYVDHQSVWGSEGLTVTDRLTGEATRSPEVIQFLFQLMTMNRVIVLGGNDNSDGHPLMQMFQDQGAVALNHNDSWTVVRDPRGHYVLFNRREGTKIRLSETGEDITGKGTWPELVDIKITDYCPYACSYCVSPDTKVLTKELQWVKIEDLTVGTEIIGFDEYPRASKNRRMRASTIESKWASEKEAVKIVTDRGQIICSTDHKFLMTHLGGRWLEASQLRLGHTIAFGSAPWPDVPKTRAYMLGYLAGMTVGDGTARWAPLPGATTKAEDSRRQVWWRVALTDREPLERMADYLSQLGLCEVKILPFNSGSALSRKEMFKIEIREQDTLNAFKHALDVATTENSTDISYRKGFIAGAFDAEGSYSAVLRISQVKSNGLLQTLQEYISSLGAFDTVIERRALRLRGGMWACMNLLGVVDSAIHRKLLSWDASGTNHCDAKIIRLESLGRMQLVDIQTSTQTFYANGFATHNCYQGSTVRGRHASLEHLQALASRFRDSGVLEVALGGGEPTLHPDFERIVEAFISAGVTVNVTSRNLAYWSALPNIGVTAVAFSVDNAAQIREITAVFRKHYPQFQVHFQVVAGTITPEEFVRMTEAAEDYRLTLLGYKDTGRGAMARRTLPIQQAPEQTDWIAPWVARVQAWRAGGEAREQWANKQQADLFASNGPYWKASGENRERLLDQWDSANPHPQPEYMPNLAIDTTLASLCRSEFQKIGVPPITYHITEGGFSMYIDAVAEEVGPCSYTPEHMRNYSLDSLWEEFARLPVVNGDK